MLYQEIRIAPAGASSAAVLRTYFISNDPCMDERRARPVVVICPGGGYHFLSPREGEPVALQFVAMGCHAAVLDYAVAPARWPDAALQLAQAILHLREHAGEYGIAPNKIVAAGFSAGGHLAASVGTLWNDEALYAPLGAAPRDIRPDALLLGYPVISGGGYAHKGSFCHLTTGAPDKCDDALREKLSLEKRVTADTPPAFLWHTEPDDDVPVENSLLFFSALHRCGVPCALHIFPRGIHGLSLASRETRNAQGQGVQEECQSWPGLARDWLDAQLGIYE